jgi:DNA-binding protein HU-beta
VSKRGASKGRNPRTGEEIQIKASRLPKFRAGKQLKDQVNGSPKDGAARK